VSLARSDADRLESRLIKKVAQASHDYRLIEPNDKIVVAVSGGKDSHVLLHILERIRQRAPFPFSLVALNIDQGQPGFPKDILPKYFAEKGYEFLIVNEDTYSVVREKTPAGKTSCSLCSRLRRGILYTQASRLGATKIALGHHRDDLIETLLLNLFFAGQIKAMPARLQSDDGRNVVIRPLAYCAETDIASFAAAKAFPIVPCSLCSNQVNLQRQRMKELILQLSGENPHVSNSLAAALRNVRPSHLLDIALNDRATREGSETSRRGGQSGSASQSSQHRDLPILNRYEDSGDEQF
jgi:tRNA 2-thiocytidine biosynthesis protein TtcA